MCGIFFSTLKVNQTENHLRSLESLRMRGPDSIDFFSNQFCFMGNTRLKIVGNEKSRLPEYSNNGDHAIIFNGQIYNFLALSKKYRIILGTESDSELVLKLYLLIGPSLLQELNGMFAFVIYSFANNSIFIARDRLGIKPLYMYKEKDEIVLSSDINSIKLLGVNLTINYQSLKEIRHFRLVLDNKTIYNEINEFPPGTYYCDGKFKKYWQIERKFSLPPSIPELHTLISDSVRIRLADPEISGLYLSGGIDSSLMLAYSNIQNTYSVGTSNSNEFKEAREIAQILGTSHKDVCVNNSEYLDLAIDLIKRRGAPVLVPNEVLLFALNKQITKDGIKVMISGEGADESFAGYDRIFLWSEHTKYFNVSEFAKIYCYNKSVDLDFVGDSMSTYIRDTNYETISFFL